MTLDVLCKPLTVPLYLMDSMQYFYEIKGIYHNDLTLSFGKQDQKSLITCQRPPQATYTGICF